MRTIHRLFVCAVACVGLSGAAQGVAASLASPPRILPRLYSVATIPKVDEQIQTFMGRIEQSEGKFVLVDETSKATYSLDNQEKAKPFDGKKVKVTGSLDKQSKTIHVAEIQSA